VTDGVNFKETGVFAGIGVTGADGYPLFQEFSWSVDTAYRLPR
jgi:hypothetical protein